MIVQKMHFQLASNLFVFICLMMGASHIPAQQLSYKSSINFGIGNVYSKISTSKLDSKTHANGETTLSTIRSVGRSYGFSLQFSKVWRLENQMGLILESSLIHARRKGVFEESHLVPELFLKRNGSVSFNNLYAQILLAPRYYFGMFKRSFVQAGPYLESNLANFSRWKGDATQFYRKEVIDNSVEYIALSTPLNYQYNESVKLRKWDFGAVIGIGTQLALPGKDLIEVELRYARGSFSIADIDYLRQNRIMIVIAYGIVNLGYSRNEKYFH
jgi:hypothetical protein